MTEGKTACPFCGTPYVSVRKFNSGNPRDVLLPECECEELVAEADVEAWLIRRRKARELADAAEQLAQRDIEPEPRIIHNRAQCAKCGEIIESTHRHDFRYCLCRSIAVDGGHAYLRRVGDPGDVIELSETDPPT